MNTLRFWTILFTQNLGKLRRQWLLLAGLTLFCAFLALRAGPTAQALLTRGVDFQGLRIAVTAPDGDDTGRSLSLWLGKLRDVKEYCDFLPMDAAGADAALAQGEVSAVLTLPAGFLDGVLRGENPGVTLTVSAEHPLEALLAYWVGDSAARLLTAAQQGIYAALEAYDAAQPPGLSREDVVFAINLRFINWTLGREQSFRTRAVSPTGALPISLHYGLSLAAGLLLTAAPALAAVFDPAALRAQRRLRCAGRGPGACYSAAAGACAAVLWPMALASLLALGIPWPAAGGASLLWAVFAALTAALWCLALPEAGPCAMAAFLWALLALTSAGGLIPPVLLPPPLTRLSPLSPVTLLRTAAAEPRNLRNLAALALWLLGMAAAGTALYSRRMRRQEVAS